MRTKLIKILLGLLILFVIILTLYKKIYYEKIIPRVTITEVSGLGDRVTIRWHINRDGLFTRYNVHQSTYNLGNTHSYSGHYNYISLKKVIIKDQKASKYEACGLADGTTYYFIIEAENDLGYRVQSDVCKYTTEPKEVPRDVPDPCLVIYKTDYTLELRSRDRIIKRYPIVLGHNPIDDKTEKGDGCVPEGEFYICTKRTNSPFFLSLGLSYPNDEDAERGLRTGLITHAQYQSIIRAIRRRTRPPWDTKLGGSISIHGHGLGPNWTLGCIAMKNEDIREIFGIVRRGNTGIDQKMRVACFGASFFLQELDASINLNL